MAWVLRNVEELVLNLLGLVVTSWVCRKMCFKIQCSELFGGKVMSVIL